MNNFFLIAEVIVQIARANIELIGYVPGRNIGFAFNIKQR